MPLPLSLLLAEPLSFVVALLESLDLAPASDPDSPSLEDDPLARPFLDPDDDRESVMYQPLPLNTMPTG